MINGVSGSLWPVFVAANVQDIIDRLHSPKITVPPHTPEVYDQEGRLVKSVVGPYDEGEDLYLSCQSTEGNPSWRLAPKSSWVPSINKKDHWMRWKETSYSKMLNGCAFKSCCENPGRPPPQLTWWRNDVLIDSSFDVNQDQGMVKNDLIIQNLQRSDLQAVLTCKASNNNRTAPVTNDVTLDMNCKFPNRSGR
jgi:hypothetical protein